MWKTLYILGCSFCFIKGQGVVLCSLKRTHSEPQSLGSLTLIPFHLLWVPATLDLFRFPETTEPVAASGTLH